MLGTHLKLDLSRIWRTPAVQALLLQLLAFPLTLTCVYLLARSGYRISFEGAALIQGGCAALLSRHGVPRESEDEFTVWKLPPQRQRIAIVAHGGTNAVAITHLLDIPCVPWEWNRFEMELRTPYLWRRDTIGRGRLTGEIGENIRV